MQQVWRTSSGRRNRTALGSTKDGSKKRKETKRLPHVLKHVEEDLHFSEAFGETYGKLSK